MSGSDSYEAWKRNRARDAVPDGFADRVLARIEDAETRRPARLVPILLLTTAGVAGLVRVAAVLALFLPE
jgi:hypothetical protein